MTKMNATAMSLLVLLPMTLSSVNVYATGSARDRAREEQRERESRDKRVEGQKAATEAARAEDRTNAVSSELSAMTGGRADSIQIELARKAMYTVEVPGRTGPTTKAVVVKISDVADGLIKNQKELEAEKQKQNISAEAHALVDAKLDLVKATAQLVTLAAKRYEGSDANLVLARDAFARQVETGMKITSKDSIATLQEVKEHVDFVSAINREKEMNANLTDAEATDLGVKKAYRESFEKRCQDGSCKIPTNDVLEAGARARLKDLKECI